MAYDTLTYEFDELPLIAGKSGNFGMLFGTAEISFDDHGEWSVKSITLTGDKLLVYSWDEIDLARQEGRKLPRFETVNYCLDEGSPGYFSIINSLETDRFEEIIPADFAALQAGDLFTIRLGLGSHHVAIMADAETVCHSWQGVGAHLERIADPKLQKRVTHIFRPIQTP